MCSFNVGSKMNLVYHINDWAVLERKDSERSGSNRKSVGYNIDRSSFYLAHIPCLENIIQDDYWDIPVWDTNRKPTIKAWCKYCGIDNNRPYNNSKELTEEEYNALNAVWEIYVKFK